MSLSRRNLSFLLPILATADAAGQDQPLTSMTLHYDALPVRANGENKSRAILQGKLHGGTAIEMHETELAPGLAPHPPHHHNWDEMLMVREGTLEVTIAGKSTRLGPGSVAFAAANDEHGWRNVGETRARYYILTMGR